MSIFHEHAPTRFHAMNLPTGAAEQHDVAARDLDSKVFIESAHDGLFGQGNNGKKRSVRNSPAICDSDHAAATPSFQHAVHAIAMEIGAIPSPAGNNAVREYADNLLEFLLREIAIRIGAADDFEYILLAPFISSAHGDDLLREHVERSLGNDERIEFARFDGTY